MTAVTQHDRAIRRGAHLITFATVTALAVASPSLYSCGVSLLA